MIFLERLFGYLAGRDNAGAGLRVLEVGCSFGHITEYLNDQPVVATIDSFAVDADFVEMACAKVEDLRLAKALASVRPGDHAAAVRRRGLRSRPGDRVVEHLAPEGRSRHVNEGWRVIAPGGHLVVLDMPNRAAFPLGSPRSSDCPRGSRHELSSAASRSSSSIGTGPSGTRGFGNVFRSGERGDFRTLPRRPARLAVLPEHHALADTACSTRPVIGIACGVQRLLGLPPRWRCPISTSC